MRVRGVQARGASPLTWSFRSALCCSLTTRCSTAAGPPRSRSRSSSKSSRSAAERCACSLASAAASRERCFGEFRYDGGGEGHAAPPSSHISRSGGDGGSGGIWWRDDERSQRFRFVKETCRTSKALFAFIDIITITNNANV